MSVANDNHGRDMARALADSKIALRNPDGTTRDVQIVIALRAAGFRHADYASALRETTIWNRMVCRAERLNEETMATALRIIREEYETPPIVRAAMLLALVAAGALFLLTNGGMA